MCKLIELTVVLHCLGLKINTAWQPCLVISTEMGLYSLVSNLWNFIRVLFQNIIVTINFVPFLSL